MRIRVQGGLPLNGIYTPSGSTNAAIHALAGALLTDQPVTLNHLPNTAGVRAMLELANRLGTEFVASEVNEGAAALVPADGKLMLSTPQLLRRSLSPDETQGFTGALLYLAPILVRRGYARLEVDFPLYRARTHLEALRDLGQDVIVMDGAIEVRSARWDFKDILLTQTSVTATSMVMMLAIALGKETVVRNAASEPHIQHLAHLLELMGAQIEGIGSNMLRIFGTHTLHGANIAIPPDYIEAASVAAIGALCGGRLQIKGTRREDVRMIDRVYRHFGILLDVDEHSIFIPRHEQLIVSNREEEVDSSIETAPWPGFPSDLVSIATVVATQARGTSLIHEKMYKDRLLFVDKLNAMGAQIVLCDPHRAIVVGPAPLHAIYMDTPDVRIGMGMLAAALVARGETVIDNAQAISRSFEGIFSKFQALGAKIVIE